MKTFWTHSQAAWEITKDRNKDTAKELSWDPDAQQPQLEIVLQGQEGEGDVLCENTSSTLQSSLSFHPHADTARSRDNSEKQFSKKLFKHNFIDEMLFYPAVGPWTQNIRRLHYWKLTVSTSDLHYASPLPLLHLPSWAPSCPTLIGITSAKPCNSFIGTLS